MPGLAEIVETPRPAHIGDELVGPRAKRIKYCGGLFWWTCDTLLRLSIVVEQRQRRQGFKSFTCGRDLRLDDGRSDVLRLLLEHAIEVVCGVGCELHVLR